MLLSLCWGSHSLDGRRKQEKDIALLGHCLGFIGTVKDMQPYNLGEHTNKIIIWKQQGLVCSDNQLHIRVSTLALSLYKQDLFAC